MTVPLERADRRQQKEQRADQRGDRVPGQPEHERVAARPEREGLARAHRDAPERLLDAEAPEGVAHEIVRPDRHAARGDQNVPFEPAGQRALVRGRIVLDVPRRSNVRARVGHEDGEHQPVRLVDLALAQRRARRPQLCPGGDDRNSRPARAHERRAPRRGERGEPRRRQRGAGGDDHVARVDVPAARPHVRAVGHSLGDHDGVALVLDELDRHDGVGALGNDATRRDGHRLAGRQWALRRTSGGDVRDDGQRARRVPGANREPVHCRAPEARQVDHRVGVLREHSSGCVRQRHRLGFEWANGCEDTGERVLDGEELGHGAHATRGTLLRVISVVVPVRDEERTVEPLYEELASALDALDDAWEVVYVDDGSRDGTHAALVRLHESTTNVRVVRLRRNAGKAAALDAGFAIVEGDFVVTIDGDLQDDPAEIPRLLAKLDEGYDLVSGWKTHRSDPFAAAGALACLQHGHGLALGCPSPRHELRAEGDARRGRAQPRPLRRAAPLRPGSRARPRLPGDGDRREPPAARARAQPVRHASATPVGSSTS